MKGYAKAEHQLLYYILWDQNWTLDLQKEKQNKDWGRSMKGFIWILINTDGNFLF